MTEIVRIDDPAAATEVGGVIGAAFQKLALSAWIVPPDEDRRRVLPVYFSILAEHAIRYGSVYATAEMSAVALWFHNDAEPPPDIPGYEARTRAAAGPYAEGFFALDAEMDEHHPHDPHHYLAFLAVLPDFQQRGLGGGLMAEHHARLDAEGIAGYLEASSTRSRELYLRQGYVDMGAPLAPPGAPPMYPMWRTPTR